jgi:hypothetical protein
VSLEIDLLTAVDTTKVPSEHNVSFVADSADRYQSDRIAPVRYVVTRPTHHIYAQERRAPYSFLLLVFPHFVPVQFIP